MLVVMIYLLHHFGLKGLAAARVCYGAIALLVYVPLLRGLGIRRGHAGPVSSIAIACELQEGSKP